VYYPLACIAEVYDDDKSGLGLTVKADLHIFGGPADPPFGFPECPACGGQPWTFDIDLHIPADMTPGVKTFAVWVTNSVNGHRADTTATIEVVVP
jgi:hypothetical protein